MELLNHTCASHRSSGSFDRDVCQFERGFLTIDSHLCQFGKDLKQFSGVSVNLTVIFVNLTASSNNLTAISNNLTGISGSWTGIAVDLIEVQDNGLNRTCMLQLLSTGQRPQQNLDVVQSSSSFGQASLLI